MPPPRLPSRETIIEIVGGLVAALFPRHHGPPGLAGGDLDAFAEARPVSTLRSLEGQIRFELELAEGHLSEPVGDRDVRAAEITSAFAEGLGSTRAITQARTRNEAFEDGGGI
jgi:serine O-acetyltransferase